MDRITDIVRPLLGRKTIKVNLEISAHPNDDTQIVLVAKPITGPVPANASPELIALVGALSAPIKIINTPEQVEAELAEAVKAQSNYRPSWEEKAAQLDAMTQSASKAKPESKSSKAETPVTDTPEQGEKPSSDDDDTDSLSLDLA